VSKKLDNEEENYQLADVITIVNAILNSPVNGGEFELVTEMGGDGHLLNHFEVRYLSCGRVMERMWNLRQNLLVWFDGREDFYCGLLD